MSNVKLCSFIRETGRSCGSPAVRGDDRCHFHGRERLRRKLLATWRVNGDAHLLASLSLPPLETPEEVQICINAVFQLIAENRIDAETRRTLVDMLRLASRNLRTAALIRHFAATDARLAKKQEMESSAAAVQVKERSAAVVEQDLSPANETFQENTAEVSDSDESLTSAEAPPPQEADTELLAQLKSREDDRKAVDTWLANRVWVAPPKPKSEVYIPPSPFGKDTKDSVSTETQDPSTPSPELTGQRSR